MAIEHRWLEALTQAAAACGGHMAADELDAAAPADGGGLGLGERMAAAGPGA